MEITPNKRKRDSNKPENLTPKKYFDRLPSKYQSNKENTYVHNAFLEVKSISDLYAERQSKSSHCANPYEVVRKPPKKKKRIQLDGVDNEALNLNGPEKVINPYEVQRVVEHPAEGENHCFINTGLNIKGQENVVKNPFEIERGMGEVVDSPNGKGIENPALELPSPLAIGVPFTPTVGCRIDFSQVPLDSLTPCSMLTKKLVFSPAPPSTQSAKRRLTKDLSVISEETVDISQELDCYQLELENSINEAKASKRSDNKNLFDLKIKRSLSIRLKEIEEQDILNEETPVDDDNKNLDSHRENSDIIYEEVNEEDVEDDLDDTFKEPPAPFIRTFRRSIRKPLSNSDNSINSNKSAESGKPVGIRQSIRNSIRKFIHPKKESKVQEEKEHKPIGQFLTTIRQSFRKKSQNNKEPTKIEASDNISETTIIDGGSRKIFKDEKKSIPSNLSEKNSGSNILSRSSLRRSHRHIMKSVFKKNVEDYSLDK